MTIERIAGDAARPRSTVDPAERAGDRQKAGKIRKASSGRPTDRVEISGEGRTLATLASMAEELGLDVQSLRVIQERLSGGFYQRPDTLDAVATRLLESGDLDAEAGEVGK